MKLFKNKTGSLVSLTENEWFESLQRCAKAAGVTIPTNAFRHSFGTYRYPILRSSDLLSEEMGNTKQVVKKWYVNVQISDEAIRDWWLVTPAVATKAFNAHRKKEEQAAQALLAAATSPSVRRKKVSSLKRGSGRSV
jgi:hypothetical protein